MPEGYFKMFRCFIDNEIWKDDQTAWHIFEYFLGRCDYKTGKWTIDYGTMSEFLKIPKATLHDAIKRLKNAKMVNASPNAKNTTFEIVNWKKYQMTERLTERKPNANRTYKRNKEDNNIYTEVLETFNLTYKTNYKSFKGFSDNLDQWLEVYSLEEIKLAIQRSSQDEYWKNKLDPTILFRQKNPRGEKVDYIGKFLNIKTEKESLVSSVINEGIK
jgi:hypothetical protein